MMIADSDAYVRLVMYSEPSVDVAGCVYDIVLTRWPAGCVFDSVFTRWR